MTIRIRRLGPGEGELLRRVRLRALADSPRSFATPLSEEELLPESEWTVRVAAGDETVFVAFASDEDPVGMAGARRHGEDEETISLWGMWVAPPARRTGLGTRLVDAVGEWAAAQGAVRLRLGVMADVPASIRFYERLGFRRDAEEHRYRRDPSRQWHQMFRAVATADRAPRT